MPYGGTNGSRADETISITVKSRSEVDMTTYTSVEVDTTYPSGRVDRWSWAISAVTQKTLTLVHFFSSDGAESGEIGKYIFSGWLIAGTSRRAFDSKSVNFPRR